MNLLRNFSRRISTTNTTMAVLGINTRTLRKGDPEPPAPAPGVIRVYNMRFCPWAERVILTLAKKGLSAEVINIHLAEKPEWYFKKHYQGKVPALEHDGKIVIESGLIPEYLDDLFPENRILPTDAYAKVQQKLILERLSVLPPAWYGVVQAVKDPSLRDEKLANFHKALSEIEGLLTNDFFGGSSVGYADVLILPFFERVYWANQRQSIDIGLAKGDFLADKYPKLSKWFKAVYNLPEIQAVVQTPEKADHFLNSYLSGGPIDYDAGL